MSAKQAVQLSRRRRPSLADAQPLGGALPQENQNVAGTKIGTPSPPLREGGGVPLLPSRKAVEEKSKVDQVLESLSKDERTELLDKLALQAVGPKRNQHRDLDTWAQAVYDAFVELIGVAVASGIGPAVFKRELSATKIWQPVDDFMTATKLSELDVAGRQAACRTVATLLVRHARKVARHTGIPLTLKLVANCTGNIGGIFDDAFPGYAAAGMARVVVTRMLHAA